MIRRYGPPPEPGRDYVTRHGAYGLLHRGGSLLLTFQAEPDAELQFPGGGLDPGESPIRALHREVYEETGWTIGTPRRIGTFRRYAFMPEYGIWAEKVCHIFAARPIRALGPPTEKGHAAIWADAGLAADLLANAGERHYAAELARRQA